jgi:hypothetical protein
MGGSRVTDLIPSRSRQLLWVGGIRVPRNALHAFGRAALHCRLDQAICVGAPFPTRPESRSSTSPGLRVVDLLARFRARGGGWVGRTTDPPGLRWQPSPAWGHARRGRDRRCRVPTRLAVVRSACEGMTHKGRQLEINTAWRPRDRRNWDLAAEYGRQVPTSAILDAWVAVGDGNGTTASPYAPGRNGLVANGRASKSGTAARATTEFGSDPNPAIFTRARTTRAGLTHEIARLVRDAVRPEPGTARQRNRSAERAEAGSASGRKLSTRTRSTPLLSAEDRITMVSISTVWIT